MKGATKTRTQLRMEKKQALILLVLVLIAALASFTLGVVVGQRGAERDLVQKQQAAEKVLVAPAPYRAAPAPSEQAGAVQKGADAGKEETKLTFYDDLNKAGTAPLGSGINLPPAETKPEPVAKPPIDLPDQPIVKKETAPAKAQVPPAAGKDATVMADTAQIMPKVDPKGSFCLQVGSFAAAGDAGKLKKRLTDRNYPAFVAEADLGKKGTWYRVRVGPYADDEAAKAMQQLLEKQDQLKGFVTRM